MKRPLLEQWRALRAKALPIDADEAGLVQLHAAFMAGASALRELVDAATTDDDFQHLADELDEWKARLMAALARGETVMPPPASEDN